MQTQFGETRAARGPPAGGLGSNTSSSSQLPGGGGGSTNSHVPQVSGLRRRNIFSLGKSDQEKVRDLGVEEDDPLPDYHEDPHHAVTMKDVFGGIFHSNEATYMNSESAVDVEHYIHDKSIRRRLILLSLSNSKFGIRMHFVRSLACIVGVLLYLAEVTYQDYREDKRPLELENKTLSETLLIQLEALVFVKDNYWAIWALQVIIALMQFTYDVIILYVSESWSCLALMKVVDFPLFVSIIIPLLYFITLIYPPKLKDLFVPAFLYCWPAKQAITAAVIQKLQRKYYAFNSFRLEAVRLFAFLVCFVFTWVCVLHHFFRIDKEPITFFETYYLVMVTMSTVGYGDFSPGHWTGRLLITVFIISAIIYLIPHLEKLFEAFQMQQKLHNSVNFKQAGPNHILICATQLKPLVLRDFLTEFYSDPDHLDVHTVVMLEQELPSAVQLYLSHPIWSKRITILIGSPLRLADLERARARSAYACFIHSTRDTSDPDAADQHTIMCAWAVRDHSPKCQLYVQILKPENRLHLEVADHIVCEGELKYALVANSCHCPGITTLMSLLLHTFKQEPKMWNNEEYTLYTACAPCEIYDTKLKGSIYFHHFVGKNFLYTAVVAFRKYRVTLIGVTPAGSNQIKLNPGIEHTMHEDDICYYIGFTREEFSRVGGVQSIHHSLQQACATLAAYSMSAVGINPNDLDEKNELEMKGVTSNIPSNASSTPTTYPSSRRVSTHSMANQQGPSSAEHATDGITEEGGQVRFFIPNQDTASMDSVSITMQPHLHVNSPGDSLRRDSADKFAASNLMVLEAKRGLQLFRFHSGLNVHANPVVKLRCHSLEAYPVNTPTGTGTHTPVHPATHAQHSVEEPLPSYHGSNLHNAIESHHLLPRLSEASEERDGSPYSESNEDHHDDNDGDVINSQSTSQNDVFSTGRTDAPSPKQLEEGHSHPLPANVRIVTQQPTITHKHRGHHLPPLTFHHHNTIADMHPSHPYAHKSIKDHRHHHHHMGFLKPHPPVYHRSLSEGILGGGSSGQQSSAPSTLPQLPPTPHKGTGTPLYSSTLSLIVPEDEASRNKKMTKSLSHEELSPREVVSHEHGHGSGTGHHHFLDFLRHPSMWSAATSHSSNDIHAHVNHEEEDILELELENIEEEEELEELEEGHCHDITQDTASDTKTRTSSSLASDEEEVERPKSRKQRVIYEKGPLPISPYCGFETPRVHLVLYQRDRADVAHIYDSNCGDFRDELKDYDGLVIVYCEEASDELYHFILPLRAHQLSAKELKPIVFMLGHEPSVHFVDCLTWLPLVYYTIGKLSNINDWLKAGISLAKSVLVLSTLVHMPTTLHHEHMIDASQIMAIQRLARLFPRMNFVTEIRYRFNVRYLRFSSVEKRIMRNQRDLFRRSDHLFYLFMPQLAAGRVYCSSMLDTLLYQTHKKSYMIDLVRQLVGCKQTPGSGYLCSVPVDKEMLSLQTYDRVFQRLASTHRAVPLGIYRTIPMSSKGEDEEEEDKEMKEERYHDGENIKRFLNARMMSLGLEQEQVNSTTEKMEESQSFVLPNPDPKTKLKPNDIILILKCPPPPKRYEPSFHSSFQAHSCLCPVPADISPLNLTSTPKSGSSSSPKKSPQSCIVSPSKSTVSSSKICPTISVSRSLFNSKSGGFCGNVSSRSMPESSSSTLRVPVAEDGNVQGNNSLTVPVECYVTEC